MTYTFHLGRLSDDSMEQMANRITLDSTLIDAMVALAEGNPGALTALSELVKDNPQAVIDLCHLDDMSIYGSDIWIGFKDVCHHNTDKFRELIRSRMLKKEIEKANI